MILRLLFLTSMVIKLTNSPFLAYPEILWLFIVIHLLAAVRPLCRYQKVISLIAAHLNNSDPFCPWSYPSSQIYS